MTDDMQIKVIDFGFTREYNERRLLDTYCGSVAYAAPGTVVSQKKLFALDHPILIHANNQK